MAGESGKIDPMYQFKIEPLAQLELAGYDVSFTNSSLYLVMAARSFVSGITPASLFLSALTIIMNFMGIPLD